MCIATYLRARYAAATANAYEREIAIYLANYPGAAEARYPDITGYIGRLRQRYNKPATLRRIVSSIKAYYDYLCHAEIRRDNPARAVRLRDQQRRDVQLQDLFTAAELEALLYRRERYPVIGYRNRVLAGLLIYQALLPGEAAALRVNDVDLAVGRIYIRGTARTSSRTLALQPSQILLLYEYMRKIRPELVAGSSRETDALLVGIRGGQMLREDITKHVMRSFRQLYPGRRVTAQTIRQSVVANLLKAGHDLSVVQGFAGHKYPGSTEKYKQDAVETLRAAVGKYHPFGEGVPKE